MPNLKNAIFDEIPPLRLRRKALLGHDRLSVDLIEEIIGKSNSR